MNTLTHPHILRIYGYGIDVGTSTLYLAMGDRQSLSQAPRKLNCFGRGTCDSAAVCDHTGGRISSFHWDTN